MHIYRDILKTAWKLLWRYPWLWVFGLLVATVGNGNEYDSLFAAFNRLADQGTLLAALQGAVASPRLGQVWQNLNTTLGQAPMLFALGLVLVLAVSGLAIWVIMVARGALIRALGNLHASEPISFSQATMVGVNRFWQIFTLNVLAKFFSYVVVVVAFLPFLISFLTQPTLGSSFSILMVISAVLFIPLALIVSFILKYATIEIVLKKVSWWQGLEKGLNLFLRNWLVSLEMAAVLFVLNLVVSLILLWLFLPDALALGDELFRIANTQGLVIGSRLVLTALVFTAVGAWFATFEYAAWVVLFRRLEQGPVASKLARTATEVPELVGQWFSSKRQ